ncbi:MAG TPA: carboxypeptidase regulatory-like domain-containing protein [Geobacteraceae bacterium]
MERSFRLMPLLAAAVITSVALLFPLRCMGEDGGLSVLKAPATHFPARYGVSPSLRDITPLPVQPGPPREIPLRAIPHVPSVSITEDPVLQALSGPLLSTSSPLNFDGVSDAAQSKVSGYLVAPPDTNGAVGATQYVQWVNLAFMVFNKDGTPALGPIPGNALWKNLGGACASNNSGDPIVQYDKAANRWVMTQPVFSGPPYYQCVAVSQTPDATGPYNLYAYPFTNFNDYPKLGVWPDAYYMSFNMFQGNSFVGAQVCAFDRDGMLKGLSSPGMQCIQLSSSYASLLPSDLDGVRPPPAGSPNYFLNFGPNSLNLWKFSVVWGSSPSASFTGPATVGVASFSEACNGGGICIPQLGTSQQLDSLGDRLMYRLAYRNFSSHESLVVNHSVATGGAGNTVGIRWYELQAPFTASPPSQQATYAPDANYRWMGSIAMDKLGDIALGYSVSSGSMYPAIAYTGRTSSDTPGTMGSETTIRAGGGSQTRNLSRWGDYSGLTIDPMDDCTFWYTNEYLPSSGTYNWYTRIASFRFSSCPAATSYTILGTVMNNGAPLSGVTMTLGGAGSGTATTDPYGNYGFAGLANGTYTVTPGATGYSSASVTITDGNVIQNFVPPLPPANLSATAGNARVSLAWTASAGATGYNVLRWNGSIYAPIGTATTTSYTDTGLTNGTTYSYVVQAVDVAGTSGYSNVASATPQATSATYSISGTVTKTSGAPLAGVTMTLSGAGSGTATTGTNGSYSFAGLANGTYTVTPSAAGYRFSPTSKSVTVSGANVAGVNFKGK